MQRQTRAVIKELHSDLFSVGPTAELPATIIEAFTKLWFESQENSNLEKLVPKDCFRTVFESMNNVFGNEDRSKKQSSCSGTKSLLLDTSGLSKLELICETCEEEYNLINNDAEYSFFAHTQTDKHLKIVKAYQEEMTNAAYLNERDGILLPCSISSFSCRKDTDLNHTNQSSPSSSNTRRSDSSFIGDGVVSLMGFLEEEDQYFCLACDIVLASPQQAKKHMKSTNHLRKARNYNKH